MSRGAAAPAQVVPGLELLYRSKGSETLPHAGRIRNQPDAEWPGKKGRNLNDPGTLAAVLQMRPNISQQGGQGIRSAGVPPACGREARGPKSANRFYSPNVTWREFATDSRR